MEKRGTVSRPEVGDEPQAPIAEPVEPAPDVLDTPSDDPTAAAADPTAPAASAGQAASAEPAADPGATVEPTTSAEPAASGAAVEPGVPRLRPRRLVLLALAAAIAFGLDLVSKLIVVVELADRAPIVLIPKVLDLQLTRNPGAAFGLAGGATVIFSLVALGVVVFILVTARRLRSRGWAVALGLLLGGALGNLGDRLFRDPGPLRGHVVDWIHLSHWPIFNLADTAIVVGGLLAVLLSLRGVGMDGSRLDDEAPAAR